MDMRALINLFEAIEPVDEIWRVQASDDDFEIDATVRKAGGENKFAYFGKYQEITVMGLVGNRTIYLLLKHADSNDDEPYIGYGVLFKETLGNIRGWFFNEVSITNPMFRGKEYGYGLYKFLLIDKHMTLLSSNSQTSAGQQIWRKLMDEYPHIFVKGYRKYGSRKKEIDLDLIDPWDHPDVLLVAQGSD